MSDKPIDIKVSDFIRIHPLSSVTDAKISGHYVNSIMAVQELIGTRYHEALLLDYKGNIAEGPGENFFMVKKGVIYTPPLGTILKGITRETIFELAEDLGYKIKEKNRSARRKSGCRWCLVLYYRHRAGKSRLWRGSLAGVFTLC